MDIKKRRKYDSTLTFDDTIPTEPVDPKTFFKDFGDVFYRNACWSNTKPIPMFGDEKTSFKAVDKFYKFW
jgi:DnaJ family protein C protein 2